MKKYFGPKYWSETLYFWTLDEDDVEWKKIHDDTSGVMIAGNCEFFLFSPPFNEGDKNNVSSFLSWGDGMWEDTNWFIDDTEEFNHFKKNRI